MHNFCLLNIKRPVLSFVFSLLLVVFGLYTFFQISTRELPKDLQPPVVEIRTNYTGASPSIISSEISELHQYTLGYQVTKAYDFSTALPVSMKEFCPDKLVLLGPGNTLGGAIGQIMIKNSWMDVDTKSTFSTHQKSDPYLISMGMNSQREIVSK